MTIRTRNRLYISLFLFSVLLFVVNSTHFIFAAIRRHLLAGLGFFSSPERTSFLFSYSQLAVYISIFVLSLYVCIVSFIIVKEFEKTQCTEISFFLCFLIACMAETLRIYIPILDLAKSYTYAYEVFGKTTTFARLLAPLSLLFAVLMSEQDQRPYVERNIIMILVISLFFAMVTPMNTAIPEKNFRAHIGFNSIIVAIEVFIHALAWLTLVYHNYVAGEKQKSAIGMFLIIAGFVLLINAINVFLLIFSTGFIFSGTFLYLFALHQRAQSFL